MRPKARAPAIAFEQLKKKLAASDISTLRGADTRSVPRTVARHLAECGGTARHARISGTRAGIDIVIYPTSCR